MATTSTMLERFWEWQKTHTDNEWTTKQMIDIAAFAEAVRDESVEQWKRLVREEIDQDAIHKRREERKDRLIEELRAESEALRKARDGR